MMLYTLAVFPPGEARMQVIDTMANHSAAFFCSSDPTALLSFLKNPSFKGAGVSENLLVKKSGDQVTSFFDQGAPSFTPDFHLKTNGFGHSDAQVNSSPPNTIEEPQSIRAFSRQQQFKDTGIQKPLPVTSGTDVFGRNQQLTPDFSSINSSSGSTKVVSNAKNIQQSVEKVPMGANIISTKQPEVKDKSEYFSSATADMVSMLLRKLPLTRTYLREQMSKDTVVQNPPPSSSGTDVIVRDQQHSSSILTSAENRFGRGDVVSGANPEPMDFDMPPPTSPAPMLHDEPVDIFDGIKPPIDLDAPRNFLGEMDLTEEPVMGTVVKEEMEDGEENLIDSGAHVDPKDKDNKPKAPVPMSYDDSDDEDVKPFKPQNLPTDPNHRVLFEVDLTKDLSSNKRSAAKKKSVRKNKSIPDAVKKTVLKKEMENKKQDFSDAGAHKHPKDKENKPKSPVAKKKSSLNIKPAPEKKASAKKKTFGCDVCQKVLSSKHSLENHLRIHSGDKPYECHVCLKRFHVSNNLAGHLRTHTGLKPFECDVCKKRLTTKVGLDRHMRTHTGEKPFACKDCEKKYGDRLTLKIHCTRYHS